MELPLIVGVDGSDSSFLAIDWAVDEAARLGLPLRLVYASLWERYEGAALPGSLERPSEQPEDAVSALVREGRNATALVTGSRGRGELKGLLPGVGRPRCGGSSPLPGDRGPRRQGQTGGVPMSGFCSVREILPPAGRRRGSPSARPRRARAPSMSYAPGAAPRTRQPTIPGSPGNRRATTNSGHQNCSTPCSATRWWTTRASAYTGRRSKGPPARCSCAAPRPRTLSSSGPGAGTATSVSSAGSATPCCITRTARWRSCRRASDSGRARTPGSGSLTHD